MKIGYARVSHSSQEEALPQQVERLRRAGAEQVLIEVESGTRDARPEFSKLLDWVKNGKATEVLVTRVDRLGRSVITIVRAVKLIEDSGAKLNVLDAPVDTSSPFGWYSISQMASLAEFESRLLSQRVKHGKDYKKELGCVEKAPFGYMKTKEGKLAPSTKIMECGLPEWEVAINCKKLYLETANLRKTITKIFNSYGRKFTPSSLSWWLKNPVLLGHTVYGTHVYRNNPEKWDIRYNTHEPLITEPELQQILRLMEQGRFLWGSKPKSALKYPLASQVICQDCGARCYRSKTGRTHTTFRCRRRDEGAQFCNNSKATTIQDVENAVISELTKHAQNIAILNAGSEEREAPELIALRSQLQGLRALGNNPALLAAATQIENQIRLLETQSKKLDLNPDMLATLTHIAQDSHFFKQLSDSDKTEIFQRLIYKVTVFMVKVVSVKMR